MEYSLYEFYFSIFSHEIPEADTGENLSGSKSHLSDFLLRLGLCQDNLANNNLIKTESKDGEEDHEERRRYI